VAFLYGYRMCDSLCFIGPGGTVFAKNSDRPVGEVQLVQSHQARLSGGDVETQYLTVPDAGAFSTLLAQPSWLWGAEHGINEHGVAIGNERISTIEDAQSAPDALIGMDLVRLGLERGATATGALEIMTELLERYGQGGTADRAHGEAYFSSFLIADSEEAWILETSGRSWVAKSIAEKAAISNRISLGTDWTRSSTDLAHGANFDKWRDEREQTGFADIRLEASDRFLSTLGAEAGSRQMVAHMRDHGTGPWGEPGTKGPSLPLPQELRADFTGVSVCMHVRELSVTTSSLVCWLPSDPGDVVRAWVAPGSPCVSVYIPVFPPQKGRAGVLPLELSDRSLWSDVDSLRHRAEHDPDELSRVRLVLDPIETAFWSEADEVVDRPSSWPEVTSDWGRRFRAAISSLL
jgi:secernin